MNKKYFHGDTDFVKRYNDKWAQYNTLTNQAETIRRDKGDQPSREEGIKYDEAMKVCEEIIAMNQQSPSIVSMWYMRRRACESKRDEIVAAIRKAEKLDPPKSGGGSGSGPVIQSDPARPSNASSPSGFTSRNANEHVPLSMIEGWYQPCPAETIEGLSGMDSAVEDVLKGLENMKYKKTAEAAKKAPPHGFFFYGPPGTGKTHLVHAIANKLMNARKEEERYQYLEVRCNDIQDPYRGVAEKIVNAAFCEALDRDHTLLFFDEFDAVCPSRSDDVKQYDRSLTNTFLQSMSRVLMTKNHVIVIVATNYPNRVDAAMVRRFIPVRIPLPNVQTREKHFETNLSDFRLEDGLTPAEMADRTDNYSYSDMNRIIDAMKNMVINEALDRNKVFADGVVDAEATDEAAAAAIANKEIVLTREMFETAYKQHPPVNVSENRAALEEYEANNNG